MYTGHIFIVESEGFRPRGPAETGAPRIAAVTVRQKAGMAVLVLFFVAERVPLARVRD